MPSEATPRLRLRCQHCSGTAQVFKLLDEMWCWPCYSVRTVETVLREHQDATSSAGVSVPPPNTFPSRGTDEVPGGEQR
jgi:hypothetical protein